ncbi:NUDIX domain-containing protein [Ramlibacter rhizophilus]|uniref:GDP-mannose pyrophosphatase n=1 Tax=Ramlibacter rhizophilus TaxID=1781167 RepID=A0A4Z0C0B4_9BURK|nr:NUDIX hydrolase [Ramlibacter rhizophilus]TFZ04641.1 NUDIX hydrolase [Ramlibacter rhizophilus]
MEVDPHLTERTVQTEELLRGSFLHVVRDTVRLPDGGTATREYVRHPGAVMMVPLLEDGRVVLERQWRHPVGQVMTEFPAGKLSPGEEPLACARRELLEETGYTAREWARAGRLHPCIGYSDEFIEIWFARGLKPGRPQLDDEEFVEVISATPDELLAWCRDGRVTDAKTLTGALWLREVLSGAWVLDWQAQSAPS